MRQVGHPVMVEAAPVLTGAGAALFFPPPKVRRVEIRTQEPDAATHAFSEAHWSAPKRRQWEVAGAGTQPRLGRVGIRAQERKDQTVR